MHWACALVALILVTGGAASLLVANMFLSARTSLHHAMLERVAKAPMSFFVSHPVGRILNRFSKDTAVADSVLVKQLLLICQVGEPPANSLH